nr:hypothetical protein Iba_chr04eCG0980 [Ipomoea batatas]
MPLTLAAFEVHALYECSILCYTWAPRASASHSAWADLKVDINNAKLEEVLILALSSHGSESSAADDKICLVISVEINALAHVPARRLALLIPDRLSPFLDELIRPSRSHLSSPVLTHRALPSASLSVLIGASLHHFSIPLSTLWFHQHLFHPQLLFSPQRIGGGAPHNLYCFPVSSTKAPCVHSLSPFGVYGDRASHSHFTLPIHATLLPPCPVAVTHTASAPSKCLLPMEERDATATVVLTEAGTRVLLVKLGGQATGSATPPLHAAVGSQSVICVPSSEDSAFHSPKTDIFCGRLAQAKEHSKNPEKPNHLLLAFLSL